MSPDDIELIQHLHTYVVEGTAAGKSLAEFWQGFDSLAGDLNARAFADDAPDDLREAYCEVLGNADDAGYAAPDED